MREWGPTVCACDTRADAPLLTRRGHTGRGLVRLRLLDTYVQALLATSEHILRSSALHGFFVPKPLDLEPMLPPGSLVILPTPEEPLSQPRGSLDIHSLEAQSIPCVQPFHTLDIRDRPFHTKAQEILDILLRHPSGWWLVENKDQQVAWFPAPYLEEVATCQGQESGLALQGSGIMAGQAYSLQCRCNLKGWARSWAGQGSQTVLGQTRWLRTGPFPL